MLGKRNFACHRLVSDGHRHSQPKPRLLRRQKSASEIEAKGVVFADGDGESKWHVLTRIVTSAPRALSQIHAPLVGVLTRHSSSRIGTSIALGSRPRLPAPASRSRSAPRPQAGRARRPLVRGDRPDGLDAAALVAGALKCLLLRLVTVISFALACR